MTDATSLLKDAVYAAFRDYEVDGIPSSGDHEPLKADIRTALGDTLQTVMASLGAGISRYATKSAMDAVTSAVDGQLGYVYADGTSANNTVYQSVSGVWSEATWYFEAVAAVVQPLLDDTEAARDVALAAVDSFTEHRTDSFGETGQTLGDGTAAIAASVLTFKNPLTRDNKLVGLRLHPRATGTVEVGAGSITGNGPVAIAGALRGSLTVSADTNADQTIYFASPIQFYEGEHLQLYTSSGVIGLQSGTITTGGYWSITGHNWSTASTSAAGANRIMVEFLFEDAIPVARETVLAGQGGAKLSLESVDKIVVVSNSYHESKATLKGKSASMLVSALSEYNFGNVSLGGQGAAELAALVANSTPRYGATFAALNPTYALISEQQNSKVTNGLTDAVYYRDMRRLLDAVRSLGALPILATEWGVGINTGVGAVAAITVDGEQRNYKGMKEIAGEYGAPFIDGTSKSRTMNPTAYNDFWKSSHPAMRMVYLIADALLYGLQQLPRPRQTMKIFRVRDTVTVSAATDLLFTNIQERHRLFLELYIGHSPLNDTGRQFYDTATANGQAGYNDDQPDEYFALQSGAATALGTYALVDCVLKFANPRDVKLTLSDTTITVYALKKTAGGASWVQLALNDDNLFVVPNDFGLVDYDKISFLLYDAGGISLDASPEVAQESGQEKPHRWTALPAKPSGAELLVQPLTVVSAAIPAQWTNSGSLAVATLGDGATYLPGANQGSPLTTGAVEVTSSAGLDQDVPLVTTDDPVDIVIRVWARRWVALFASGSDWSTAPVTEETCDTATLQVTLHGATGITSASAVFKAQVGLAWTEIEFRTTIPAWSTDRRIDVRSADLNIQVAKVSVRAA